MDRLVVVATPLPLPDRFDRARWPAHVTVVPNFVIDGAAAAAVTSLARDAARNHPEFTAGLGPLALFGPSRDVPVLLAEHSIFHELHAALAGSVSALPAFRPDLGEFWGVGYRPHTTIVSNSVPPPARHISITNLAVVALDDPEARTLANCGLNVDGALT